MSADRIDVLAVMDRIASLPVHEADDARNQAALVIAKREAAEARAAVAELIEADTELDAACASLRDSSQCGGNERSRRFDRVTAAQERRRAVLARIGGAA